MRQKITLAAGIGLLAVTVLSCNKNTDIAHEPGETTIARSVYGNPNYKTTIGTNVQEFNQLPDGNAERLSRKTNYYWSDFDATGLYLPPNTSLNVTLTQLQGTGRPTLLIGTYARYQGISPRTVALNAGANTVAGDANGGIIWVRYTTTGTPNSRVRLTFNSGHRRMPVYIKNQTTQTAWNTQLSTYTTPDALLLGDRVYVNYDRNRAISYQPQNNNQVLQALDAGWNEETRILGLDGSAGNQLPVHNRILITEVNAGPGAANATNYRLAIVTDDVKRGTFTPDVVNASGSGWGIWHEMGHVQQVQWRWSTLGEVTNNIFALAVEENVLRLPANRLKRDNRWPGALAYVASTAANKNFNVDNGGHNVWTRLCMFQQLRLAYGYNFFITLHKRYRSQGLTWTDGTANSTKMRWFMINACQISGRNLTNFFKKWGFTTPEVSQSVYTEITALGLPNPSPDPSTLQD